MENEEKTPLPAENTPVSSNEAQSNPVLLGQSKKNKKLLIIVAAIIVVIGLLLVVVFLRRTNNNPSVSGKVPPAEPANVLLATVGGKKIYRLDVKNIALEQYLQSAIDSKVMKMFLDIAVERAILDIEAEKLKLAAKQPQEKPADYYAKVKEQVIQGTISSINATQIGWWIPPEGYPQKPLYETQRAEGAKAVEDIKAQFANNVETLTILKNTYDKYPSLQSVISINGTRYTGETVAGSLPLEREYDYDKDVNYFPKNKLMVGMSEGQIKGQVWEDGSGGVVIKVNKITRGEKIGYRQWLQDRIKALVVYNTEAVDRL